MAGLNLSLANGKIVKDYSKAFWKVEPVKYPTASFALAKMGDPLREDYVRIGERENLPDTTQVNNGAGYTAVAVAMVVDNTDPVRPGMYGVFNRTGEGFIVGDVDHTTKTISDLVRGAFGTAAAVTDNETITWLPTGMPEGWTPDLLVARMRLADEQINNIERFVEPVIWTGTMEAITENGGLQFQQRMPQFRQDAQDLLKRDLNVSLIFGRRDSYQGSTGPVTMTGGIAEWAYYQNTSAVDISNRANFETLVKDPLKYGGPQMMMPCSSIAFESANYLYQASAPQDYTGKIVKEVGVQVSMIQTPWGKVYPYIDWTMDDYYDYNGGTPRWLGQFAVWNPDHCRFRPLRRIGRYNLPQNGDNFTEVVACEGGWEFGKRKALLFCKGVTKKT